MGSYSAAQGLDYAALGPDSAAQGLYYAVLDAYYAAQASYMAYMRYMLHMPHMAGDPRAEVTGSGEGNFGIPRPHSYIQMAESRIQDPTCTIQDTGII